MRQAARDLGGKWRWIGDARGQNEARYALLACLRAKRGTGQENATEAPRLT